MTYNVLQSPIQNGGESSMSVSEPFQAYSVITLDEEAFEVCEYLCAQDLLALDTETYQDNQSGPPALKEKGKLFTDPFTNKIRLVQVRSRDSEAFIFDLYALSPDGKAVLTNLLEQPHITWIGHNLKFDYRMIAVNLGVRLNKVYDTMLAATCIGYAIGQNAMKSRGNRLKDVVRDYLDNYMDKTEQTSNWGAKELTSTQLQYAADDLLYLFELYDVMTKAIKDEYQMEGGVQLEMDALPVVADIELNGIHLDSQMYQLVQASAKEALPALEEKICQFIEWPMIATPPILRKKTGRSRIPKPYSFEGESKSPLDSNQFMLRELKKRGIPVENLQGEHLDTFSEAHPILKDFMQYKDLSKQLTVNYNEWVHPLTGKIHPEFNQSGASTGRFACNNPNLQQVPKMDIEVPQELYQQYEDILKPYFDEKRSKCFLNYRYCFVVPSGYKMASADYSGQEVRVMVALSKDPNMIAVHWEPEQVEHEGVMQNNMAADIHAKTAELVWGERYGVTCWTAKKLEFPGAPGKKFRDIAKAITFGLAYGKSAMGLSQDLGISEEAAEAIIEAYFKPYLTLKRWLEKQGQTGADTRIIQYGVPETGVIRWRMLNSGAADSGALKRAGMNTPIQGTSALMMKKALVELSCKIKDSGLQGIDIIGTVHDEVLVRFPEESESKIIPIISDAMDTAAAFFLRGIVPPKAGIGISTHWSKD